MTRPSGYKNGTWMCVDTAERDAIVEADGLKTGNLARIIDTTEFYKCTDAATSTWVESLAPGAGAVPSDGVDSSKVVAASLTISDMAADTFMVGCTATVAGEPGFVPGSPVAGLNKVFKGDGAWGSPAEDWAASTAYSRRVLVVHIGVLYRSTDDFTSGASFNAGNWENLSAGSASPLSDHDLLANLANDAHEQYLNRDGVRAMTGDLDMATHRLEAVGVPVQASDAATKGYVDANFGADWFHTRIAADVAITRDQKVPFAVALNEAGTGGLIVPDAAEPTVRLKGGKAYRLSAHIAGTIADGYACETVGESFAWMNLDTGAVIGTYPPLSSNSHTGGFGGDVHSAMFQPDTDTTVALVSRTGAITGVKAGSWAFIETMGVGAAGGAGTDVLSVECGHTGTPAVGQCVYISGPKALGKPQVDTCDIQDAAKMPAWGVVTAVSGPDCTVVKSGPMDTSSLTVTPVIGQPLYVAIDGTLTPAEPVPTTGQTFLIQQMGLAIDTQELDVHPNTFLNQVSG